MEKQRPRLLFLAVLPLTAMAAVAAPEKPKTAAPAPKTVRIGPYTAKLRPSPASAVALADADSETLPKGAAAVTRYVWVEDSDVESMRALSLTANYTNHGDLPTRPVPVVGPDGTMLLRLNLAAYAPKGEQLEQFLKLWEDYQFDPKFSKLLTRDTLKAVTFEEGKIPVAKVRRKVRREQVVGYRDGWRNEKRTIEHKGGDFNYPDDSGNVNRNLPAGSYVFELKFKTKEPILEAVFVDEVVDVKVTDVNDVPVVRLFPEHVNPTAYLNLVTKLRTQAPIVSGSYWMCRHISTVKENDDNNDLLWSEIYGGRYYEFMLYQRGVNGVTDEDLLLRQLGVGSKDETAQQVYDRVSSDQRAAVFESEVTGKPRRIDVLRTLANRNGQGLFSVTHDLLTKNIDISQHPLMNLSKFKDAGREGIYEKQDGLHGFYITDGKGNLQDVAPQALVEDHEIPRPHTKYLQCAIGCIRCHGLGRDDGWKVAANDAKAILKSRRADIFSDLTNRAARVDDTLMKLAGQYMGDFESKSFPRGRSDYADAVLMATGPWPETNNQNSVVKLSAARISKIWNNRNYVLVTARQALLEMGLECDEKNSKDVLDLLLPPTREPGEVLGQKPDDPRLHGLLSETKGIKRVDWDLYYGFAAPRAAATLTRLQEKGK